MKLPTQQGAKKTPAAYEFNSRKIKRRLEQEGWFVHRIDGDHHILKHPTRRGRIILCHPKKDLPLGTVRQIYKDAGWQA